MADAVGETYEEFKTQLSELSEGLYAQTGIPFSEKRKRNIDMPIVESL